MALNFVSEHNSNRQYGAKPLPVHSWQIWDCMFPFVRAKALHAKYTPISLHYLCNKCLSEYKQSALREFCSFSAGCSVRFKCRGVSARTRSPACKYNPLLCSTLVFPPSSDTGNYAIHSLPSSASNHDSLSIRSHLSSILKEASEKKKWTGSTYTVSIIVCISGFPNTVKS